MALNESNDDKTQSFIPLTGGTEVGHYKIIEKIGAGGMGEVYLAEDRKLKRQVALKFMPLQYMNDDAMRERFTREARAVAALSHPNIVTIFEVGEFNGRPFFAMEHIKGKSLREVIKKGKLSTDEAVSYTIQICEGLHKAHESGIIHRDIKPGNIIIDTDYRVRILDFGLAMVTGEDKITKTGSTLGTIGYMSVEQIEGKKVDQRSDIFSVGVILYEMVTGRRPFEGDNDAAVVKAITSSSPEPVARFKSGVTGQLQSIIDKALVKDASLRYQHADGMLADLKRLQKEAAPNGKKRTGLWIAAIVLIGIIGLLLITRPWIEKTGSGVRDKIMIAVLPFENLGNSDDEYFADGMTEEITSRLGMIHELGVISRTSAMYYKNTDKDLPEIAKELGVDYILEGTVRWDKSGDIERVKITPQLIQVSDNTHMWTNMYESELTGIFEVQGSIASEIAMELDITLLATVKKAIKSETTENIDAYKAFLRGQELDRIPSSGRNHTLNKLDMYQRAIELDSNFALAYAGLSGNHIQMYVYNHDRTRDRLSLAKEAAEKSIDLAPDLAEGHTSLAGYYLCTHNYENAIKELEIAERLRPSYSYIYFTRGTIYSWQGNIMAALSEYLKAERLDPFDGRILADIWMALRAVRQFGRAIEYADKMISLHPDVNSPYMGKAIIYFVDGLDLEKARKTLYEDLPNSLTKPHLELELPLRNYDKAMKLVEEQYANEDATRQRVKLKGKIFWLQGELDSARIYYDSLRVIREKQIGMNDAGDEFVHDDLADCYAVLGKYDKAIQHAKNALEVVLTSGSYLRSCRKREHLAQIYIMIGKYDMALDEIEYLLSVPSLLSVYRLKLYAEYDPLRDIPRFQELLEKYGKEHGTE